MYKLFVYGILKQSQTDIMKRLNGKFLSHVRTVPKYDLIRLGGIAGLKHGEYSVAGELWEVDDNGRKRTDQIEGHPNFYHRDKVEIVGDFGEDIEAYFHPASEHDSTFDPDDRGIITWKGN